MQPIEVSVTAEGIVEGDRPPRDGIHLSDVIQYYRAKTDKEARQSLSEMDYHRFKIGQAFEAGVLSKGILFEMKKLYEGMWRSYKFAQDGIEMEADAAHLTNRPMLVFETKYTHLGMNRGVMDAAFRLHHWQLCSYVHNLERITKKPAMGRLVYCYGVGNWTTIRQPVFKAWDMPWSRAEKVKNWDRILGLRDQMVKDKNYRRR